MNTMDELAVHEAERLQGLLFKCNVPGDRIALMQPIIENVAWMKIRLDDAREKAKTSSVVIPYDNGGGQKGIRENPLYKGYCALWKSYVAGMDKSLAMLPKDAGSEAAADVETPQTVLQLVRAKHGKSA